MKQQKAACNSSVDVAIGACNIHIPVLVEFVLLRGSVAVIVTHTLLICSLDTSDPESAPNGGDLRWTQYVREV